MAQNFSKGIRTVAVYGTTSTTAGTLYSDQVICNGEGCRFIITLRSTGTGSTGTVALTIIGTNTSTAASTSYTAVNGAALTCIACATASSKRIGTIDVLGAPYKYLKAKLVKTTKIEVRNIIAEVYGCRVEPTTNSTATYARTAYAAATAATSHVLAVVQSTST